MKIERLVIENVGWLRLKSRRYYPDNIDDADDLTSETIYKLLKASNLYDSKKGFRPWALSVMHNTYITAYNRRKCVPFTELDESMPYFSRYESDHRATVNRILSVVRTCARKSCCIECVLLYAKGFSYDEIAVNLEIPVGTVRSRISAGRKMLHEALD